MARYHLLSDQNAKTEKSEVFGYYTVGLMLAPGKLSGIEVCPSRGACYKTCIFYAGMGRMSHVQKARIKRTREVFRIKKNGWLEHAIECDLWAAKKEATRRKLKLAVRLNVFSDIPWEDWIPGVFRRWPDVQFYDYTKIYQRAHRSCCPGWPANYQLVWSWSEKDVASDRRSLAEYKSWNISIAAVGPAPAGWKEVDGDAHDLIFLHPAKSWIRLNPKGKLVAKAAQEKSAFFTASNL